LAGVKDELAPLDDVSAILVGLLFATPQAYRSSWPAYPVEVLPSSVTDGKAPVLALVYEFHAIDAPSFDVITATAVVAHCAVNVVVPVLLEQPSEIESVTEYWPEDSGRSEIVLVF